MRFGIATIIAAVSIAFSSAALGDQDDSRLDGLFQRLQVTGDFSEAQGLEAQIWDIWFSYDRDGGDVSRLMGEAAFAMQVQNHDRAEDLLTRVTDMAPEFAEGWNRRATSRYLAGDYAGSIEDIRQTLELEPRHFGALSGLGLIYAVQEDPERALAAFEAALDINPHLPGAQANVQALRRLLGDPI